MSNARRVPSSERVNVLRRRIRSWYKSNGRSFPWRRRGAGKYERVVTEVLLQRTRAETIAAFSPGFFARFPTWESLALTSRSSLEKSLRPIGLYTRRAAALSSLASVVLAMGKKFPRVRGALESLPGVGQYVASAILVIHHGEPEPFLDVNMARVLERYFGPRHLADIRHDPWLQELARKLVGGKDPLTTNFAVLDFAALVCKSRVPRCGSCPLRRECKMTGVLSSAS